MADSDSSPQTAAFWAQADALLRKNLTYQKRNFNANCRLISFPFVLCTLLIITQKLLDNQINKKSKQCGCQCIDTNGDGTCETVCGLQFSDLDQSPSCPVPSPLKWPPLLQVPAPQHRAVRSASNPSKDLPDESCRQTGNCPVTILITGTNQTLGQSLAASMFSPPSPLNSTNSVLGSDSTTKQDSFLDPAFVEGSLYNIQSQCTSNSTVNVSVSLDVSKSSPFNFVKETVCVPSLNLWRNSSSEINDQIYRGYEKGNAERQYNEILGAYDFLNSNANNFNVNVWYNATNKDNYDGQFNLVRLPRALNLVSNAYLQLFQGRMVLEFIKEMPKPATKEKLDIASLLGTLFFAWVVIQLFPVVLTALVYEKQQKLRIMMKMHGLGDGPYWMISYMYFLVICALYMVVFVAFGSLVVVGYICVFATGLLGAFLFQSFVEDASFPILLSTSFCWLSMRNSCLGFTYCLLLLFSSFTLMEIVSLITEGWILFMELYPGFALYRGLYEFAEYALRGNSMGTDGMKWGNLSASENGMSDVMIIMLLEWIALLFIAYYVDQVFSSGSGKNPKYLLQKFRKKRPSSFRRPSLGRQGSKVFVDMDKPDVVQEREKVEQLLLEPTASHSIVCDSLRKVYPGRDGNREKLAVRGLSLAIPRGECFGMLGPNGAGKTSFISMMIGLTMPTTGTAYVEGLDIQTQMDWVYTSMGVCPQHDLLWETLTGREHLLFYGRLKNLKGASLKRAVEESLRSVNLFNGGVADKQAGKYSGGMKRRLSVAISLIGDPKVVYMDEPSTGLDPASRNNLWKVVKRAKQDRAIILTTHSMEEAEYLCDRLGIFVDGSLQCVGNPKELRGRYGGSYVFTMTTSVNDEHDVEQMVRRLSPGAEKTYQMAGTQKFEMPKQEVSIADVFEAVEVAKSRFPVYAWGLSDTTLEDVFIKVANSAQQVHTLT
ncbi:hypothetical protein SADUNF_Sadunf15G0056300 [Salix dunnii]|uniref:ABC transporter domain-containing protein n=1 Tax=Salix dunnii TaxID=1413687 RepID=A0A835JG56_9ROSI|nr:hypothetical protein SADUNF_Sadunf15G0056300 [Salix dunnii]